MRPRQIPALLLALALLLLAGCPPAAGEGSAPPTPPGTASVSPEVSPALPPEPSPEASPKASPTGTDAPPAQTPQASPSAPQADPSPTVGDIWLYGELHAEKNILEEELHLWKEAYDRGVRHLFIEYGYFDAGFLNLWMGEEDDAILDRLYDDWADTQAHNECVKEFYRSIKADCPETVFHGTDVGHQYQTTGRRYLLYLSENGLEDSEQYRLARECIEQGEMFYRTNSVIYREKKLVMNFIREAEALEGEEIMGFYGAAHTGTEPFEYDGGAVSITMAEQLQSRYGEKLHLMDLSCFAIPELEPERIDAIQVGDKTYEAAYFGAVDISAWSDRYSFREFWRLEGAYDDFRDAPTTGQVLPYDNYPTRVKEGEVFVIDYTRPDGAVERKFYRSDGGTWNALPTTVEFLPEG